MDGTTVSAELGLDLDMASCDGKSVLAGIWAWLNGLLIIFSTQFG